MCKQWGWGGGEKLALGAGNCEKPKNTNKANPKSVYLLCHCTLAILNYINEKIPLSPGASHSHPLLHHHLES